MLTLASGEANRNDAIADDTGARWLRGDAYFAAVPDDKADQPAMRVTRKASPVWPAKWQARPIRFPDIGLMRSMAIA